jgi:hypothetical protein
MKIGIIEKLILILLIVSGIMIIAHNVFSVFLDFPITTSALAGIIALKIISLIDNEKKD